MSLGIGTSESRPSHTTEAESSTPAESELSGLRAKVLGQGLALDRAHILEVGPLDRPVFARPAFNVKYVDHAVTDDLRTKYHGDPNVGRIVDTDFVWDGTKPLADVTDGEQFDCVIACHVIEHIPNPIGWLLNVVTALRPDGVVGLAVPDKRFTFDYNRRLTEASDLVDAYVRRSTLPSYAQLYDFHTKALPVDAVAAWAGTVHYSGQVRPGDLRTEALEGCINLRGTAAFQDVHCHTFTPASFVEVFLEMAELGILPFRILQLVPTFLNTVEFYVRLQPVDPDAPDDPQTLADFAPVLAKADSIPPAYAVAAKPTTPPHFRLSDRERRFIEAKRRALIGVRRFLGQIPH